MKVLQHLTARPDNPEGELLLGPGVTWVGGVILPLLMALYALVGIAQQHVLIYGSRVYISLQGISAVVFGIGVLGLAGLLHFQCFWDSLYDSTRFSARSKLMCTLVTGVCAYVLCYRMLYTL